MILRDAEMLQIQEDVDVSNIDELNVQKNMKGFEESPAQSSTDWQPVSRCTALSGVQPEKTTVIIEVFPDGQRPVQIVRLGYYAD